MDTRQMRYRLFTLSGANLNMRIWTWVSLKCMGFWEQKSAQPFGGLSALGRVSNSSLWLGQGDWGACFQALRRCIRDQLRL